MMKEIIMICFCLVMSFSIMGQKQKPLFKNVAAQWAEIPAGTLQIHSKDSTVYTKKKSLLGIIYDSIPIHNFWMSKTEITNFEYAEFVEWIKKSGDANKLKIVLPDTLVWRHKLAYNEPYVDYYFRHPAYRHYPVVGVTHQAALLYCEWLTEIYNAKLKVLFPKLKAKKILVKLPTVNEWMWAAKGGLELSPYPWGGPYIQNSKGYYLANFKIIGDEAISYNTKTATPEIKESNVYYQAGGWFDSQSDITVPVLSYNPNNYGLYNLAGNVAEMTSTPGLNKGGSWFTYGYDIQIEAPDPFQGDVRPKAFVGFRPIFIIVD